MRLLAGHSRPLRGLDGLMTRHFPGANNPAHSRTLHYILEQFVKAGTSIDAGTARPHPLCVESFGAKRRRDSGPGGARRRGVRRAAAGDAGSARGRPLLERCGARVGKVLISYENLFNLKHLGNEM